MKCSLCTKCSRAVCTSLRYVRTALARTRGAWRIETVAMFAKHLFRTKNQANLICDYKPVRCYRCKEIHDYTLRQNVPRLSHLHSVLFQGLQDFTSPRLIVCRASSCFSRLVKHRIADSKVSQIATANNHLSFSR